MKSFPVLALTLVLLATGRKLVSAIKLIRGGKDGLIEHYAYSAAIFGLNPSNASQSFIQCSGVLISPTHVLTSASCCETSPHLVTLGMTDTTSYDEGDFSILSCVPNKKYNRSNPLHFNVAVIEVEPRSLPSNAIPIKLVTKEHSSKFVDRQAFLAGWGQTQEAADSPNALQVATQRIISRAYFEKLATRINAPTLNITEHNILSESRAGVGSLYDFGGALVVRVGQEPLAVGIFTAAMIQGPFSLSIYGAIGSFESFIKEEADGVIWYDGGGENGTPNDDTTDDENNSEGNSEGNGEGNSEGSGEGNGEGNGKGSSEGNGGRDNENDNENNKENDKENENENKNDGDNKSENDNNSKNDNKNDNKDINSEQLPDAQIDNQPVEKIENDDENNHNGGAAENSRTLANSIILLLSVMLAVMNIDTNCCV